jgi:hypothetical protein|tara:strand:+ start:31753 stop:33057 length:1305 start_codon:yes stop_codon:yes gene_type:complete
MPRLGSFSSKIYFNNPQSSSFSLIKTIANPNAYGVAQDDFFANSVAINSNYAVIGSIESDATAAQNGKVYVFSQAGTALYTIDNPTATVAPGLGEGDMYGRSVGCSASYIIAGAQQEDVGGNSNTGIAYIHDITDGSLLFTLNNPNPTTTEINPNTDLFGSAVAISENFAAVSSPREDINGIGDDTGWIFLFDTSDGSLLRSIENPNIDGEDEYPGDQLGERIQTLAMNDTYTVVGSWRENTAGASGGGDSGAIHIITNATGAVQTILNPNPNGPAIGTDNFDQFGYSVDISDSYIIVGAINEDVQGTNSGNAYIFELAGGSWSLARTLANPNVYNTVNNDLFGSEVAITDTYCAISAVGEDNISGTNSGAVYIFNPSTGALLETLENPNSFGTVDNDKFGTVMSASTTHLLIGVPDEDAVSADNSGAAYIYKV